MNVVLETFSLNCYKQRNQIAMKTIINENDPRVIRTRHLLLDAFVDLVRNKEFRSITVKDITEHAQVNRATFYAHFLDKYDILECAVIDRFMNLISNRINSDATLSEETLRNITLVVCEYVEAVSHSCKLNYATILSLMEEKVKLKLCENIVAVLKKESKANSLQDEKYGLMATMISSSIYAAARKWNSDGRGVAVEDYAEEVMNFIVRGINVNFPVHS